ncbi:SURF1 family protein, partial [Xanthomonas perforans]
MTRKHTAVIGWCLALLVSAGFAALGHWQLQRMQSKQALLDRAAHV